MITDRAKSSFDRLLIQTLADQLIAGADDICVVEPIQDRQDITEKEFVVLTSASYLFRLIVFFHFTCNTASRAHFARIVRVEDRLFDSKAFYDAVSEFGNLCCGALNRDLATCFPHVGMSTPNVLEHGCFAFLDALKPGYTRHFQVMVNQTPFHASLCVCDYGNLDFVLESKASTEGTGQLELF